MIAGDFNTPVSPIDRSSRQKLNVEMLELTGIINQMDLTGIFQNISLNTKEYSFISAPHETFSKTEHIIRYNESLNRYKEMEITPFTLSDHLMLDINNNRKLTKSWKLNNSLLNEKMGHDKKEIEDFYN